MSMRQSWATLNQAERDAAYNNTLAVPNAASHRETRAAASARYRAAHAGKLDVPFGAHERQCWDLFPAADPAAPCLVFIHGGYWQMNRREDFAIFASGIAEHGWSVAMPGYSLAPEAPLAQIVTELRASLDWLAIHGPEYGITGPIIVSGWSAGGQLAAMLLDHALIQAGLAISGVYELGPLRDTYLNAKLQLSEQEIAGLSPLRLPVIAKPLAIAYGSRELPALVNDSRDFHALRAAAHAPGPLLPIAGADHFTILHELQSPGSSLVKTLLTLV
jgi:acetyl esterase/lipase